MRLARDVYIAVIDCLFSVVQIWHDQGIWNPFEVIFNFSMRRPHFWEDVSFMRTVWSPAAERWDESSIQYSMAHKMVSLMLLSSWMHILFGFRVLNATAEYKQGAYGYEEENVNCRTEV